jgi:hypothetical protein
MKTKKIFFTIAVCSVMLFGISCSNDNLSVDDSVQAGLLKSSVEEESPKLAGTFWKLDGIVDVETNEVKVLEPKECDICYTLAFNTDISGYGKSSTNQLQFDFSRKEYLFGTMTEIGEIGDGYLFSNLLHKIHSFSKENDYLKLSYEEEGKQYCLRYSKLKAALVGNKWKLQHFVIDGEKIKPESEIEDSFWIIFKEDLSWTGISSINQLSGTYSIDVSSSTIDIELCLTTEIYENEDGRSFVEKLQNINKFRLSIADGISLVLEYSGDNHDNLTFTLANDENKEPGTDDFVNPYRETIIGKWKLLQFSTLFSDKTLTSEIIDGSSYDITYDFQTNGKLEISGTIPDDLAEGEYSYFYQIPNVGPLALPGENLTIGDDNLSYCFARTDNDTMIVKGEKITGRIVDEETGVIVEQGTVTAWTKTFIKLD